MNKQELIFTRWKDLGSIFYKKGIYRFIIYENQTITLINPIGIPMQLDVISQHQEGGAFAFGVLHSEYRMPGSLILKGNTLILMWEGMNGIKLKM